MPDFKPSTRLIKGRALVKDVWSIYNAANLPADCINLGQGYMNFSPPEWVVDAAREGLSNASSLHCISESGQLRLKTAIRDFYAPLFQRPLDIDSEILVSKGAHGGQYSVFTAFLDEGDEVIMFEPYFDMYRPAMVFNSGKPVYVPLHPQATGKSKINSSEWLIDFDELRCAITPRAKMIIVNTPHNPVGKVFTKSELEKIAALATEFNLIVMADEVYDCLVYDGKEHVRFATLPGMWERTVTVGSAGKSFAATGWRIGWLIGPSSIIAPTFSAFSRMGFSNDYPLQIAVAVGFEQANDRHFFKQQLSEYADRRAILTAAFDKLGMRYTRPEGGYFILLDVSNVVPPADFPFPEILQGRGQDFFACWFIALKFGVASIPASEFYCKEHAAMSGSYARFAFCKDLDTLEQAGERLQGLKNFLSEYI